MRLFYHIILACFSLGFLGLVAIIGGGSAVVWHYGKEVPDHSELKDYEPPIVSRIYAGDGRLMAEYAQEKRVFIPYAFIPETVIQAFVSAEDKNFFDHKGIDVFAIARAMVTNVRNIGTRRRPVGASTITQQVAKNFLLNNEISYERKIKEAILAMRMEKVFSKERLLELYLNEIYLGRRAYGVAAAALTYFNKSLDDLTLAETAYLAALPKAPNNYHPVRNYEAAITRRNWVLDRMVDNGAITFSQAELAKLKPLEMILRDQEELVEADYFSEEVRRELEQQYTAEVLYSGGLAVRTSVDPNLQSLATQSLREGLMAYDKRHGWRGPLTTLENFDAWDKQLQQLGTPKGLIKPWKVAVVLETDKGQAKLGFSDRSRGVLKISGVKWARQCLEECYALGPKIQSVEEVVQAGDVIMVEEEIAKEDNDKNQESEKEVPSYSLQQVPTVQGGIIALDPHTGRVLAMQGGWDHGTSVFNRATQAYRQPGSAFKPFVYLPALEKGFTPATLVLDAPFVIEQAPGDYWRPTNYSNEFYGPTPIRVGIEKSRNLMTVRLADHISMETVIDYAERFGIADEMHPFLSYALGAGETTLIRLTTAYAMLVNGGKTIKPTFIDRIQDRYGTTIFSHDTRPCPNCGNLILWDMQETPLVPDTRKKIADERSTYQVVSILEGVVQRGTGRKIASLGHPLAGKTGTTNESKDTWFIGFSPDLAVGVFIGFDDPKSLGKRETGSSVAAPVFKAFMKGALKNKAPTPFRVPAEVRHVRINAETGRTAGVNDKKVIWEAFVSGTEPNVDDFVLDTKVISGGGMVDPYGDPYGYEQFGYGDYAHSSDSSVENIQPGAGANANISTGTTMQQTDFATDPALLGTGGLY